MFDINAIINNAIATAVAEAIKPLDARIEALEMKLTEVQLAAQQPRIAPEDNPATGLDYHDITQRVVSLLNDPMFSGQMRWLADTGMEERMCDIAREIANEVAEATLSEHTEEYDHDNYDSVVRQVEDVDFDGLATEDSIRENIEDVLNNCTLSIRL